MGMGKRKYYRQWLYIAFRHSIGIPDGVAFFIGIFGSVLANINPTWESALNALLWQIPLGVFSSVILLRLILAPYWIYKKIEGERDELLNVTSQNGVVVPKQNPALFIGIEDTDFGLSGDTGYPLCDSSGHKARWIRLSMVFKGNVSIETLELVISGKTPISAFEWEPGQLAYYYYFQIPDWVKSREERTIQVRAFANGVKWGSPEMAVNFPAM